MHEAKTHTGLWWKSGNKRDHSENSGIDNITMELT